MDKKSKKIKIAVVVGTRPNFVKIAPLFWEFKKHRGIMPVLIHTGQHYDYEMSQILFQDLDIPEPDYDLGIGSGTHATQTAQAMIELEKTFLKEKPDIVIVAGDVNSTLAGALVAIKMHIPIAHIEAGPRMYDMNLPEEVNRILVDHVSTWLFCPTKSSVDNLNKEGITKRVYFTGDTMYDTFRRLIKAIKLRERRVLGSFNIISKQYILLTAHRADNVDNREKLENIIKAVIESGEHIIFPVHPRTRKNLDIIMSNPKYLNKAKNIRIINPISYSETIILEKNARKICTDSGGIQKEAYWLGVPCITMLDSQGWVETFHDGWNALVGADRKKIARAIAAASPVKPRRQYFGNGTAAKKIISILLRDYGASSKK